MALRPAPKLSKVPLETLLASLDDAAPASVLYLADPWPWTTGTLAGIGEERPIWAAAEVPMQRVRGIDERNWDLAVREINRRADPGPTRDAAKRKGRW